MICIASDHAAIGLRRYLADVLRDLGNDVQDLGVHEEGSVDYPDFAHEVARQVASGEATVGVLVCGTGLGMSMAANRHPGIRAAVCHDAYTAEMARRHNDANVLCVGARVLGDGVAAQVVKVFLETEFEGGRHQRRVQKIDIASS